jgi:hypothetical protein
MRSEHIVSAASSLLGVALLIVTAVHITGNAGQTFSDEVAFGAALLFIGSCLASHKAIVTGRNAYERLAEWLFPAGLVTLTCAVLIFWF